MTTKIPKLGYSIVLGALLFTFTVAACNNKGGGDKDAQKDTATKMSDTAAQMPAPPDSTGVKKDSITHKPTQTGD